MSSSSRRDFIKDSAVVAALAGAGVFGKAVAAEKSEKEAKSGDAASQLRVAVIGVHGRGKEHVHGFAGKNNCVVTTICDADSDVIGKAMSSAEKAQGMAPEVRAGHPQGRRRQEHRRHLASPRPTTGTRSPPSGACRTASTSTSRSRSATTSAKAGASSRRPASTNASARPARRAAAAPACARRCEFVHDGKLGKVNVARGLCYKPRGSIGKVTARSSRPKTVDYDLWCGPAP